MADLSIIARKAFNIDNSETITNSKIHRRALVETLNTMRGRVVMVLVLRDVCGMTLRQCAEVLGVTPERVRQIECKAYRMLWHRSRQDKFQKALARGL
jgi:RNA polymerase sigma factor (sigma-70 family)